MSPLFLSGTFVICKRSRDVRFWSKMGHIGRKSDKSGTILDQISEHFGSSSENVLRSYLKSPRFVPFTAKIWHTQRRETVGYLDKAILYTDLFFCPNLDLPWTSKLCQILLFFFNIWKINQLNISYFVFSQFVKER